MIESRAVDKLQGVMSYADALNDMKLLSDENHAKVISDLHDARAFIIQALMRYESVKK
jgi:hypothetical protein